jgi:hypothetical protein
MTLPNLFYIIFIWILKKIYLYLPYNQLKQYPMSATTAQEAYIIVSGHLARNCKEKTAKSAIKKFGKELKVKVGAPYNSVVDTIVDAYYNMDNYAPSGTPIDVLYKHLDNML